MRKKKTAELPMTTASPHPLLGAIVEFTNTWREGWPKQTGLVTDVTDHSLIISLVHQVIIVPIEVVRVVRTVLQGSIWLYDSHNDSVTK